MSGDTSSFLVSYEGITNTNSSNLTELYLNGQLITSLQNIPNGVNTYDILQWDEILQQYVVIPNTKIILGKNSVSTHDNTIILNASPNVVSTTGTSRLFIAPIRNAQLNAGFLLYDFATKEVSYSLTVPSFTTSDITISNLTASKLVLTNGSKLLTSSSYNITDLPILSQNNTFTGLNSFASGTVTAPSIRFDSDTGFYSSGDGNIDIATNGTRRLNITDRIKTYAVINALAGTVSAPSYSFEQDTDTGMYQGATGGELNFSCNSQQILSMTTAQASFKKSIRTEQGLVTNPSYSFTVDSDTGMYQSTGANIDFTCNGTNRFNISTLGIMIPSLTATKIVLTDANQRLISSSYNITDFYTQSEILALNSLSNYYVKSQTYTQAEILALNTLSNYYVKSQTYTQAEILALNSLSNYYVKSQTYSQAEITTLLNLKSNLSSPVFTGVVTAPAINLSGQTASKMLRTDASKNLTSSFYDEGDIQGYIAQNFDLYNLQQTSTFDFTSNNTTTISVNSITTGSIFRGLTIASCDITLTTSFSFTGSISGTTLTVPSPPARLRIGCYLTGSTIIGGTKILSGSGTTWTVNISQTAVSQTITVSIINYPNVIINSRGTGSGNNGTYIVNQIIETGLASVSTGIITTTLNIYDTKNYALDGTVSSPAYTFDSDTDTGIYRSVANQIDFTCGGVRECYINQSGFINTGIIYNSSGSTTFPSYTFINDADTGMYSSISGQINFTCDGTQILNFNVNSFNTFVRNITVDGSVNAPAYSFNNDSDTGMYRTTDAINMSVNGTRQLHIKDDGNIYIGKGSGTGTITGTTIVGGTFIGKNTGNNNNLTGSIFSPVAVGDSAGLENQKSYSVAVGFEAGKINQGSNCVAIGSGAGISNQHNGTIIINASTTTLNSNDVNRCFINPVRASPTAATAVQYNIATKELVTFASTRKIKKNIQQKINFDVDSILKLNIVQYDSIEDDSHNPCGLIAEECYEINPEFVCLDGEGLPHSINYFTLMLYSIEKNKRQEIEIQSLKNTIANMQTKMNENIILQRLEKIEAFLNYKYNF